MKLNEKLCKLLDRDKKGYVTMNDVKNATIISGTVMIFLYLFINGVYMMLLDLECVTTAEMSIITCIDIFSVAIAVITVILIIFCLFVIFMSTLEDVWDKISDIKLLKCNYKEDKK